MCADWPLVTLKEAGVSLIDCDHKTPKAQEEGFPYVGIPQLKDGRITLDGARLITEDDFHHWRRKAAPSENDIILSRRCNPGETAYVSKEMDIALGQNLVLLRSNGEKIYPPFLRWATQGRFWWEQVNKFINVGAVFNSLKCADIPNFEIKLPPFDIQKRIANILGSLDKQIENNTQTNQTLEAIAQTLFKSWFVDFGPVKAKLSVLAAGGSAEEAERAAMCAISTRDEASLNTLQTEQPEAYAELARTAALFPSIMQDSELGEIPEGWELSEIGKEVTILGGGTPSTKQPEFWDNGDICWTTPKDLSNATDQVLLDTERKITKEGLNKISSGLLPNNTVLLSSRAPVGYLALTKVPLAINQGYIAMRSEQNLPPEYVLLWASSVMDEIKQRASGTTFAEISKKNFKPIKVIVPAKKLLDDFAQRASKIYDQIANQVSENSSLTRVRDTLLPKILSGELTLPDNVPTKASPPESDTLEGQKPQQPLLMEVAG